MKRRTTARGFSMTELLVVVAIILILASILMVTTGEMFTQATELQCRHRLSQLGKACQMFANVHRGQRLSSYDRVTYRRWYDELQMGDYITDRRILNCPAADPGTGSSEETETATGSDLPLLLYNTGTGRPGSGYHENEHWDEWATYVNLRAWLDENMEHGYICVQGSSNALVRLQASMLTACSQIWFLNTEFHDYKPGQNVFDPDEVAAIHDFHQRGGGIACWSEAWEQDDFYRSTNNVIEACGDVGLEADYAGKWSGSAITWVIEEDDHPTMTDDEGSITRMQSACTPALFRIVDNDPRAHIVGSAKIIDRGQEDPGTWNLIAVHDNGTARTMLHGSFMTLLDRGGWPSGDIQRLCITSEKWLRRSGGLRSEGRCTYGYNNLVGRDGRSPAADTIVIMDYIDWEIDRDGANPEDDDDAKIALRHGGRANALMGDGSIRALRLEDVKRGMWTPEPGD